MGVTRTYLGELFFDSLEKEEVDVVDDLHVSGE
jgi:hypothetical protein